MEISSPPHHHHHHNNHQHHHHNNNNNHPLPSPNSSSKSSTSSTTTTNNNNGPKSPSTTLTTRSDPTNPYPTTFVQADTSSFKQVVQMLTGSSPSPSPKPKSHPIPPIKPSNKSRPSTKLYERRSNSFKHHLNISPLLPTPPGNSSPRYNNNNYPVSPSMLDFPSLMLSPVTPLIYDPFTRSPLSSDNSSPIDKVAEDKAIAEKGFFLHPVSPNSKPRLLPLFPVTSPKVSSL